MKTTDYAIFKGYFLTKKDFKKFRKWYHTKFKFKYSVGYLEPGFTTFG